MKKTKKSVRVAKNSVSLDVLLNELRIRIEQLKSTSTHRDFRLLHFELFYWMLRSQMGQYIFEATGSENYSDTVRAAYLTRLFNPTVLEFTRFADEALAIDYYFSVSRMFDDVTYDIFGNSLDISPSSSYARKITFEHERGPVSAGDEWSDEIIMLRRDRIVSALYELANAIFDRATLKYEKEISIGIKIDRDQKWRMVTREEIVLHVDKNGRPVFSIAGRPGSILFDGSKSRGEGNKDKFSKHAVILKTIAESKSATTNTNSLLATKRLGDARKINDLIMLLNDRFIKAKRKGHITYQVRVSTLSLGRDCKQYYLEIVD